jgi:lysine 2,3-aminomutase
VIKELVHKLVRNRVRPYYLYQCDMVHGAGHFRTPVSVGLQIMESLRGHTSGFAIPTYVIDAPAGGGKIPILPNYVLSQSPDRVVVRNYEGFISAYAQPEVYQRHDPHTCPSCRQHEAADEGMQEGVSALLRGATLAIRPEGFEVAHRRAAKVAVQVPTVQMTVKSNGNGNGHRGRKAAEHELAAPMGRNGSNRR